MFVANITYREVLHTCCSSCEMGRVLGGPGSQAHAQVSETWFYYKLIFLLYSCTGKYKWWMKPSQKLPSRTAADGDVVTGHFSNVRCCCCQTCDEKQRFQTLLHDFINHEEFHIDFMVFIIVASVSHVCVINSNLYFYLGTVDHRSLFLSWMLYQSLVFLSCFSMCVFLLVPAACYHVCHSL